MIHSEAVDVEIFPNLFTVTFVDIRSYNETFKDCIDNDGNPIPLTDKLSVKEINDRLELVKSKIFWISDTDDSQLLELVAYLNNMQPYYETKVGDKGEVYQTAIRTDLFGFNNFGYDDYMIKAFLMKFNHFDKTKYLISWLYDISKKIIDLQKQDKQLFYEDKEIQLIKGYKLPYTTVDVQQIYGLHAASVIVKDDQRIKTGKPLKQTAINLKWHEILEFTLPPIDKEEKEIYWDKISKYSSFTLEQLQDYGITQFDRYVLPKYLDKLLYYNKNDVFLVCEMARQKPDEIKLRYSITKSFGINVLCSARANIADKLTTKFYSEMSGLDKNRFVKERTIRTKLSFNKVIFPHIQFKTKQLQDLLEEMKSLIIYHTNKDSFNREITFYGTTYTLATGGIHTQDLPKIYKSDDKHVYFHHDYNSYYPSIMAAYNVAPKHLNEHVFVKMITYLRDTRVLCKHTKDSEKLIIPGVPNKTAAEALKIVINSIYGKLGSDTFFLYDRLAQLKVTINGQLMTLTLIEELELNGIHVISANTDGIIIKLPRDKFDIYKDITKRWNETNKMGADYEEYDILVTRDINNYFDIQSNGTVEYKGELDPKQYIKDLKKGYDMPIVAKAVFEYFVHNIPVMETLQNHTNILDFCKTQNIGNQFNVFSYRTENGKIIKENIQKYVRFYVSTKGCVVKKEHKRSNASTELAANKQVQILNTLDDIPISERNINYKYYYDRAYDIINPIKLGISPSMKADTTKKTKSGKALIKKYNHDYLTLFDDEHFE